MLAIAAEASVEDDKNDDENDPDSQSNGAAKDQFN